VEFNHTRTCELLVGFGEVNMIGVEDQLDGGPVVLTQSILSIPLAWNRVVVPAN
jgi:hypothetical protein